MASVAGYASRLSMKRKASSLLTSSWPVSIFSGKRSASYSRTRSLNLNRKAALQDASSNSSSLLYSRSSRSKEYLSGPTLYTILRREYGLAAPSMHTKPHWVTVACQWLYAMKSSQSALEALEKLDRLLPELELSLHGCGTDGANAVDERSASETNSSLVIASRDVHGFRGQVRSAECGVGAVGAKSA